MIIDFSTFLFTTVLFLSGIGFGWYCYESGKKFGYNELIVDLTSNGIIQFDDEGNIIPVE